MVGGRDVAESGVIAGRIGVGGAQEKLLVVDVRGRW